MIGIGKRKMQLKDGEYLKRNILAIYDKHYDEGKSFPYYRFMGKIEFEALFQEKKIYYQSDRMEKIIYRG